MPDTVLLHAPAYSSLLVPSGVDGRTVLCMAWPDRRNRIDRDAPTPVWRQVVDDLVSGIESGELVAGRRLPSDAELMEIYGVAHGTARKAVSALVEAGAVERVHGRGTFTTGG